jgi:hypothetical protein
MAQILLRDLSPGTPYSIQVRAVNSEGVSEWSPLYLFTTVGDTLGPSPVTSLSWTTIGTAFSGTWTAPTTNSDASPLKDFRDYQVTLTANSITAVYYVTEPRFDLSFEQNKNAFGTPQATVQISVRARDISGNLSTAVVTSATNPAPAQPANLIVTALSDSLGVAWDQIADADLDHYEVYVDTSGSGFTPGPTNLSWTGLTTGTIVTTFGDYSVHYVKVCAVDVFGTRSTFASGSATPGSAFIVDLTAPDQPTALAVTGAVDPKDPSGANVIATVTWSQTSVGDLSGFTIRYRKTGDTNWFTYDVTDGSLRATTIGGLSPGTGYDFQIKSYDFSANTAGFTSTQTMSSVTDSSAPSSPSGVTLAAGVTSVIVFWTENTETDVKNGAGTYEVQIATNSGFTTGVVTNKTSATVTSFTGLVTGTTYWARVRAVDSSGNASSYAASTPTSIATASITNADIATGTLTADRLVAATITGDKIAANTIDAASLKVNTTFTQNLSVGATFTMAASGIIASSNYSPGSAGWQLTQTSLEINGGTISAAALNLQLGQNLMPLQYADFEFRTTFYSGATFVVTNAPTLSIDTTGANVKYNTQSLKIIAGGSSPTLDLTTGATTYNIVAEGSTTYIVSMWVLQASGSSQNVNIRFKDSATSVQTSSNLAVPNNVYTRVQATFTTNSAATGCWVGIQIPASITVWLDGVQIEKQLAGSTVASAWKPPSTTSIDGGTIKTGSIQSTVLVTTGQSSGTQPAWSINVGGSATFVNALIRGHLIVGDSTSSGLTTDQYIASANYSVGTAGYLIRGDGNVEFNNGTFRGVLSAATGSFSGSVSASAIQSSAISGGVNLRPSVNLANANPVGSYDGTGTTRYTTNWSVSQTGTGTAPTLSAITTTSAPNSAPSALEIVVVAGASRTAAALSYALGFAGMLMPGITYTLGFSVKSISGSTAWNIAVGSTVRGVDILSSTSIAGITTSWTRKTISFTVPTYTHGADTYISWIEANATLAAVLDITEVQLEIGASASTFTSAYSGFYVSDSGQIWSGNGNFTDAPFRVDSDGTLLAYRFHTKPGLPGALDPRLSIGSSIVPSLQWNDGLGTTGSHVFGSIDTTYAPDGSGVVTIEAYGASAPYIQLSAQTDAITFSGSDASSGYAFLFTGGISRFMSAPQRHMSVPSGTVDGYLIGSVNTAVSKADFGTGTFTTAGGGLITITHNLSGTPNVVIVQSRDASLNGGKVINKTSSDFQVEVVNRSGAVAANGISITVDWVAFA